MENIEKLIGKRVKEARKSANLTQKELADNAKCSLTTINRLEKGRQMPHRETLREICKFIPLDYGEILAMMIDGNEIQESPKTMKTIIQMTREDLIKAVLDLQSRSKPHDPLSNLSEPSKSLILEIQSSLASLDQNQLRSVFSYINELRAINIQASSGTTG